MTTTLYHVQLNVSDAKVSFPFYMAFFKYFEYEIEGFGDDGMSAKNNTTDFWIFETHELHKHKNFHRKQTGLNHLAFKVKSKENVDLFFKEFLQPRNIEPLYSSPKIFKEYREDYYAVYFDDPDRIKIKVMYFE